MLNRAPPLPRINFYHSTTYPISSPLLHGKSHPPLQGFLPHSHLHLVKRHSNQRILPYYKRADCSQEVFQTLGKDTLIE